MSNDGTAAILVGPAKVQVDGNTRNSQITIDAISPAPNGAGVVASNHPVANGKAPPWSTLSLDLNSTVLGLVLVNGSGLWSFAVPAQLNGAYTLVARGSGAGASMTFTINDPLQPLTDYLGRPALFDMNNMGGVFYAGGTLFASGIDLLASVGAAVSGVRASFGGVESSISPTEYFSNPTFDALPTLLSGNGYAPAVSGGQLQVTVTAGGGNNYVSYSLPGYKGRAFRFSGEGNRGTSSSNPPFFAFSQANSQLGGNLTSSAPITATTPQAPYTVYGSGGGLAGNYYGVRGTNTSAGVMVFDNWSIRETMPLAGWADFAAGNSAADAPSWTGVVDIPAVPTLPAAGSVKVLVQADANSERHRVAVRVDSTGALTLIPTINGSSTATLALGTFAPGDRVRVVYAIDQGTNDPERGVVASVNGAPRVAYAGSDAAIPGVAFIRIGQDSAGASLFDGTYNQMAFLRGRAPADWCEATSRLDDTMLALIGDSYVDGAGGVSLKARLGARGFKYANIAQGGTTLAAQATRYQSKPYLRKLRAVHWDGSDNGYTSITDDLARYQALWDAQGTGRMLFLSPVAVPNPAAASSATPSAQSIRCKDRTAALIAQFGPGHVFDPLPALQALAIAGNADDANDVAAGLVPRSCLQDATANQVHLSNASMTAVDNGLNASGKVAAL